RPGIAPSSHEEALALYDTSATGPGTHEFVHVVVVLGATASVRHWGSEDLSTIAAVFEGRDVRWITTVPSYCHIRRVDGFAYLYVRCNLGDLCEVLSDGALQIFVLGWNGRESQMVKG